jgi:hypothetical protein
VCCYFKLLGFSDNGDIHHLLTDQSFDGKQPDHFHHQAAEYSKLIKIGLFRDAPKGKDTREYDQ